MTYSIFSKNHADYNSLYILSKCTIYATNAPNLLIIIPKLKIESFKECKAQQDVNCQNIG